MKGLELCRNYYEEYGERMLKEQFPDLLCKIAVGVCGSGSECMGYDDDISTDHDFEPGFCIFIPDEDILDRRSAFLLERAYAKLPKEYMGYKRALVSAVGGNRHGVIYLSDFFASKTGDSKGNLSLKAWCRLPEQSLIEATNGEMFFDGLGLMSKIREELSYLPEDVRLKKLAGNLLVMGQSGQYNYGRCIKRNETAAAQLAVIEFVKSAINVIFLLNKRYVPYYKWSFKAFSELKILSELKDSLEYLITTDNDADMAEVKADIIEKTVYMIADELRRQKVTRYCGNEAEGHAYSINNMVKDEELRNLHVLYAV